MEYYLFRGATSNSEVILKGVLLISNVSFLSGAKVTSKFIDNIPMMKVTNNTITK